MKKLGELFLTFCKIGAFTFGGGYAMISLLDYECVEHKKWITEEEFMNMTVVAESTPGPIAINCATYAGYQAAGLPGAVCATVGMVLPSFLIILLVSRFLAQFLELQLIANAFRGIRAAVSLLIMQVAVKMIQKLMKKTANKAVSMTIVLGFFSVVFVANLTGVSISTIYLIVIAGIMGFFIYGRKEEKKK